MYEQSRWLLWPRDKGTSHCHSLLTVVTVTKGTRPLQIIEIQACLACACGVVPLFQAADYFQDYREDGRQGGWRGEWGYSQGMQSLWESMLVTYKYKSPVSYADSENRNSQHLPFGCADYKVEKSAFMLIHNPSLVNELFRFGKYTTTPLNVSNTHQFEGSHKQPCASIMRQ